MQLNSSKAFQSTDIPTKIRKIEIFFIFPSSLKNAEITPVFKKSDRNLKDNCRPVSILLNISKIFERCIF